jgi:hypothetical protein
MTAQRPVATDPRLQLVPASARTRFCLWLLAFALPIVLSLVLPRFSERPGSVAHLVGESLGAQRWLEHWIGAGVVALLMGGICLMLDCFLRRHRLRIDPAGIEIDTTLYRRRLSWPQLDLAAARVIDIDEHPEAKPMLKTNGYALPGFRSGWFRARDFSRLFVAVAGGSRLLRIPTRLGYALLLQPADPQALLARLRDLSEAGSRAMAAPRPADR